MTKALACCASRRKIARTMPSLAFPTPEKDDPTSVISALETGKRDWENGELRDAARWVHRAADAAEAAGNDGRALELARAAADIVSSLESVVPPTDPDGSAGTEANGLAAFDDFNDQTIVDSPAVLVARQSTQGAVNIEDGSPIPGGDTTKVRSRTTLRVALGLKAASDGRLSVAILPDGAELPQGTTEALLVVLDPDARIARS